MIEHLVKSYYPLHENENQFDLIRRSQNVLKSMPQSLIIWSSYINDLDIMINWMYFAEIIARSSNDEQIVIIPNWILTFHKVSCIIGSIVWVCIASDGWVLEWIRNGCRMIFYVAGALVFSLFFEAPSADLLVFYVRFFVPILVIGSFLEAFERCMNSISNHRAMFLFGILLKNVPQLILVLIMERAYNDPNDDWGFAKQWAIPNVIISLLGIYCRVRQARHHLDVEEHHHVFSRSRGGGGASREVDCNYTVGEYNKNKRFGRSAVDETYSSLPIAIVVNDGQDDNPVDEQEYYETVNLESDKNDEYQRSYINDIV